MWSDPAWLVAKLALSGVPQIYEDIALTPEDARPSYESLQKWLILSAPALDYDYRQLAGQLVGRAAPSADIYSVIAPGLLPSHKCLAPDDQQEEIDDQQVCISAIYRLSYGDQHHAAALSAVKDEMSLWDFATGHCDKGT